MQSRGGALPHYSSHGRPSSPVRRPAPDAPEAERFFVVIPAWNEVMTVGSVVTEVLKACDCEVLVVDDASTDGTADAAQRAGAAVLVTPFHCGSWLAIQAGLRYARGRGVSLVVTLDADGQHPVGKIADLVREIQEGGADVAIGSDPVRFGSAKRTTCRLFLLLTGLAMEDLTSGMKAYGRRAMDVLLSDAAATLEYQDVESLLLLRRHGMRIREVPVSMSSRQCGRSKIFHSWSAILLYMFRTFVVSLAWVCHRNCKET